MGNKYRNLFSSAEWEHFLRMGASYTDPESKKEFYDGVIERKQADPSYNLLVAFPRSEDRGLQICGEILEMLKGRVKKEGESA